MTFVSKEKIFSRKWFISYSLITRDAFVTVIDASEILGKGFSSLHEKVTD